MKTSSCKAKGRRLVQHIRERLLHWCPDLEGGDIGVPATSQPGADLWLSPKAKRIYPFVIEAKAQESLNIWSALKQAGTHRKIVVDDIGENTARVSRDPEIPVVCFTRNREGKTYVALDLEDFLRLIR
jgi:hypothetical protein